jgi:periplasmic divalent cation tolerance protein
MTMLAVVTTVAGMDDARRLAALALDQGLAACVQLSAVESHFRWQGRVQCEPEVRLLFKTEAARYAELEGCLLAHHPYELPAIFALPVAQASAGYADWVRQAVDASAPSTPSTPSTLSGPTGPSDDVA